MWIWSKFSINLCPFFEINLLINNLILHVVIMTHSIHLVDFFQMLFNSNYTLRNKDAKISLYCCTWINPDSLFEKTLESSALWRFCPKNKKDAKNNTENVEIFRYRPKEKSTTEFRKLGRNSTNNEYGLSIETLEFNRITLSKSIWHRDDSMKHFSLMHFRKNFDTIYEKGTCARSQPLSCTLREKNPSKSIELWFSYAENRFENI